MVRKMVRKKKGKRRTKYGIDLDLKNVDWEKAEKIFSADKKYWLQKLVKEEKSKIPARELLTILAAGTVIVLSFAIPALPMAVAPFVIGKNKFQQGEFNRNLKRFEKQKLVKIYEENGRTVVRISDRGRIRALRYKLQELVVKIPKAWDRKWRLVIFDIPEKYRHLRDLFRSFLKIMGFYQLQKSVWVHPYPCFDEIEFLRQIYHVEINVTYIVAESIEGQDDLKEHFPNLH